MAYSITLTDGTVIDNLEMNGTCFISDNPIDEDIFMDNLYGVVISDGEIEEVHEQMDLIRAWEDQDKCWFALREVSPEEMEYAKNRADIQYLAMMADIEL